MNTVEAVHLTRLVAALVPGTVINDDTSVAWALVLDDVSPADAQAALRTVYRERGSDSELGARRIEADDILREVKRMRADRVSRAPTYIPSRDDLTPQQQAVEQREYWRRVGDGEVVHVREAVGPARTIPVLTRHIEQA